MECLLQNQSMKGTIRMNEKRVVEGTVASEIGTLIMEKHRLSDALDRQRQYVDHLKKTRDIPAWEMALLEASIDFYQTEYWKLKVQVSSMAQDIAVDQGKGYIDPNTHCFVEHGEVLKLKGDKPKFTAEDEASA